MKSNKRPLEKPKRAFGFISRQCRKTCDNRKQQRKK